MTKHEATTVIEFAGNVDSVGGDSRGHYTCDIKDKYSGAWYHTNDNAILKAIRSKENYLTCTIFDSSLNPFELHHLILLSWIK